MKILDRYMVRELLGPFVFGFALFVTVMVSGQYLFKLTAYMAKGAPFLGVVELFLLRIVVTSTLCLPMAMLLAALLSFGRLSSDSELIAIQAGGIRMSRVACVSIGFGILVSILGFILNEFAVPPAMRMMRKGEAVIVAGISNEVLQTVGEGKAFVVQDFEEGRLSRVVIARHFDQKAGSMQNVIYLQLNDEGRVSAVVEAREAVWVDSNRWQFKDARITGVAPASGGRKVRVEGIPEAEVMVLNKTPGMIGQDLKKPEEMSYFELERYIDYLKGQGADSRTVRDLQVGLHNKLSMPFASLVFALLGTPLGIRRHRSGHAAGLTISIVVIFAYYVIWHSATILGENGYISTVLASWSANIVGIVAGLLLIFKAER